MTYLDEAYRRFKLPIRVEYRPEDGHSWISCRRLLAQAVTSAEAKHDYLAAVKELSHD